MIRSYKGKQPKICGWVAEDADVIGDVQLDEDTSVFFQTVIRADKEKIWIKRGSNIQDGCILHTDPGHQLIIHEQVTIGHGCILHGCMIEKETMIGMGAIIMNGAHIGTHTIIGAGTLVPEGKQIPANSVVIGNPARILKEITPQQIQMIIENAQHYIELSKSYKEDEDEHTTETTG